MSLRSLCISFVVLLGFAAGYVILTSASLPDRVASHFGTGGAADAFMTRDGYRRFMLLFAVGLPVFMVAMLSGFPKYFPAWVNIPNRQYWLAPERRDASLDYLARQGLLFGCIMVVFICVTHGMVIHANAQTPPRLAVGPLVLSLLMFLVVLGLWIAAMYRRFKRVA